MDPGHPAQAVPDRLRVGQLFDWLAPRYDSAVVAYSLAQDLRWKFELVRRLRPRRGERALDLACGTGLIYDRLARRLGVRSVVGLDVNRTMLERARAHGPPRQLVLGDSLRLPFRDAAFDLVTAGYLFKYVPLERLASEVRRVLRPRGRFGGYDFSAPIESTPVGRGYGLYLRHVLPSLARFSTAGEDGLRSLFAFLERVASTSQWESRVEDAFRGAGFEELVRVPSLGGAVTWFWAGSGSGREIV